MFYFNEILFKHLRLIYNYYTYKRKEIHILMKYELVNFCEFDKYAAQSFCAIHNISESYNFV